MTQRPPSPDESEARESGPVIVVRTAVPLTTAQSAALREMCVRRYGPSSVLTFQLDPAVIGGVQLRVGDTVIDGSIAGRIEQLRHVLRERLNVSTVDDRRTAS